MTFALWMILATSVLIYATVYYAKHDKKYNNSSPREFLEQQKGAKKRAYWAHQNGFEIFPLFAAAVIIAHMAGAPQAQIDMLAGGFVLSRIGFTFAYIMDRSTVRSLIWGLGFFCIIGLFVISA